jgi:hypothetical protein
MNKFRRQQKPINGENAVLKLVWLEESITVILMN